MIEGDYATLEMLVSGFGEEPERKVRGWATGGGIYEDFLRLATARGGKRDATRLTRLVSALVKMADKVSQGSGVEGLEERVAFREMSRAVASWTGREDTKVSWPRTRPATVARAFIADQCSLQTIELSSVLNLPLTGDARLAQTAEMSRRYYSLVMAGGY